MPAPKFKTVGYDCILSMIKEHAPVDHTIRISGWDKAYKGRHALIRALERVEVDEYTGGPVSLFGAHRTFLIIFVDSHAKPLEPP